MSYLARLKQLESVKNSHYAPCAELPKPTKAPVVSFVSSPRPPIVKKISDEETAIRAWLGHIGELDRANIIEVLGQCRDDAPAREYFLRRSLEVPPAPEADYRAACGECRHFERIDHPNLGHCAVGEPEAVAGLWDTDPRWCESYEASAANEKENRL